MASTNDNLDNQVDMFRPPLARGMRTLDRNLFKKTIPIKAARVFDNKNISKVRSQLERSKDALKQDRLGSVYSDPDPERAQAGRKCILLRPEVTVTESMSDEGLMGDVAAKGATKEIQWPFSPVLTEMVNKKLISIIPYQLHLDYSYWTYHDIITAILPSDAQNEIPSGFSQVGHVAHLNLREEYLPYKNLIAEILSDKNPTIRTVINKIDDVGEENAYRTFRYEVLAGPDDMNVTVSEENCTFSFDYSKVYWNTRLHTEHARLVHMFQPGEAVCDVMAGIGPFAVPAGKNGVFVWANDLNPDSHSSLQDAIKINKVGDYVRAFNEDGGHFIRSAAAQLLDTEHAVEIRKKQSRRDAKARPDIIGTVQQPKTFQHFVLNLPASAIEFLSNFIGLYPPRLRSKLPAGAELPIVHVYCFSTKDELDEKATLVETNGQTSQRGGGMANGTSNGTLGAADKVCASIGEQLQHPMRPGKIEEDGGVEVFDVRDVAPKKRMFCASFRLPKEVAFRNI